MKLSFLTGEERIALELRALYDQYGYALFRMGKFEEYDLYARHRDFLISEGIITFTDTDGRLLALKPDVTLSIARSGRDQDAGTQKLCYDESVYRVSKTSGVFTEIRQLGLECIGDIDDVLIAETVALALESLACISKDHMLYISQTDILNDFIDRCGFSGGEKREALTLIASKSAHGLHALCEKCGVHPQDEARLTALMNVRETPRAMLDLLRESGAASGAVEQLDGLVTMLDAAGMGGRYNFDFSLISDANYYNGVAFKGYVRGVPDAVLTGGRYDRLMRKLGRRRGAIGFAVYMDRLPRLNGDARAYDVDTLLLYDAGADVAKLDSAARSLREKGERVLIAREVPQDLRYAKLMHFDGNGVAFDEDDA